MIAIENVKNIKYSVRNYGRVTISSAEDAVKGNTIINNVILLNTGNQRIQSGQDSFVRSDGGTPGIMKARFHRSPECGTRRY